MNILKCFAVVSAITIMCCMCSCGSEKNNSSSAVEQTAESEIKYDMSEGFFKTSDENFIYRGKPIENSENINIELYVPVKDGVNSNNEQLYKYDKKVYSCDEVTRLSPDEARDIVCGYAQQMCDKSYQRYELCGEYVGENETVSDCSGLIKLSYLQIGFYTEHYADAQANDYGRAIFDNLEYGSTVDGVKTYSVKDANASVNYNDLEKGDLLFFLCSTNNNENTQVFSANGIGHVGMYMGSGKMAHFTSDYGIENNPCRVVDLSDYEQTLKVVKAVRYIES